MKHRLKLMIVIVITIGSSALRAQSPSHQSIEGTKSYGSGINIDSCRINILTVGYKLDMDNGQPTVYCNVKWKGNDSTSTCLANEKFDIFLTIGTDTAARYVYAGNSMDIGIGNGNYEWGSSTHSGPGMWEHLITKNFGLPDQLHFYSAEEAQVIWNTGFAVKTVKIVTSNGRVFILK